MKSFFPQAMGKITLACPYVQHNRLGSQVVDEEGELPPSADFAD
jgi:hypothetical protein